MTTKEAFTMDFILEAFDSFARNDEFGTPVISRGGLYAALTSKAKLAKAETEWNLAHGLTATCPECGGAMKDDGRITCTFACHRARSKRIDPHDPEFANMNNHPEGARA